MVNSKKNTLENKSRIESPVIDCGVHAKGKHMHIAVKTNAVK